MLLGKPWRGENQLSSCHASSKWCRAWRAEDRTGQLIIEVAREPPAFLLSARGGLGLEY